MNVLRAGLLLTWEDGSPHQETGSSWGNKFTCYMRNEIRCWGLCISVFCFRVSFSGILGLCHQTEGKDITIMDGGKSQLSAKQMFWLPSSACLFLATESCCVLGSCFASSRYKVTLPIIIQFVMAYWSFSLYR